MNVLFIGDIVGSTGRKAVKEMLPELKKKYLLDIVIANGENAAGGRGITSAIANEFFNIGIHGITMGNHTWDNKDIFEFIDDEARIVRPANYPPETPGRGSTVIKANGYELLVINVMGRVSLPPLACPFSTTDELIQQAGSAYPCVLVDVHAEATSEKIALGWHLDGKVSAVIGTHTHVQTNDEVILPHGTGYVTDVGMVGSREGVLGMEREAILRRFKTQLPVRFTPDQGYWQFHAVLLDLDEQSGKTKSIKLIRAYEDEIIFA